ncbi:MAG: DPP IV N-terminal domain-containing protein [Bacteroidales bacterium]|nr:DPP IV N-terminal domain-containing protein [Bacteroidales bacterium]
MKHQIKNLMFLILISGLILGSCSKKMSDIERGKKFMKVGDYANAVKSFELAVWDHPDNPDVRYDFGEALRKTDENRKAYRQYSIAAKIGSKEISDRFTKWCWELYEKGDSDVDDIARLAIIAHEKNPEAQFLYGQATGYSGLPFLRDALDWSSDKKIVEPIFRMLDNSRIMLTGAFLNQITKIADGFEEFGPVRFSPMQDELIWSRAKKDDRGRYQYKDIQLYKRSLSDTICTVITSVGTSTAFPCCSKDSTTIYYSDGSRIYQYNLKEGTTVRLMNGAFPDVSENGGKLLFTQNWNIFISDTSGKTAKQLARGPRYNEYNFMPKFIHPSDNIVVFLSYRNNYLGFYQVDTSGTREKQIATVSRYGFYEDRPWLYAYDISPDGKTIAFSRDNQLYLLDIETVKEDTLALYGAYPSFSPDGKKLAILTRQYGETGEVAMVNLDEVFKAKTFFQSGKADRGTLLNLFKKATKEMKKEKVQID